MSEPTSISLLKRSNGYWYILCEVEGRIRWKSTHSRSKQEAVKAVTCLKESLKPKQNVMLLSKFTEDFLACTQGTYATKTTEIYKNSLLRLKEFAGDIPLLSLTSRHIDTYKAERLLKVAPVSVNIELRALKSAMNVAMRWKIIEENPFRSSPQVRVPERSPSYFSKEDFQKLLSIIKEQWLKELLVFAVVTGMRRGEIMNLRWDDVDLSRKLLVVRSSPTFRTKHGKKRVVPLSDIAMNLLSVRAARSNSEYVFTLNDQQISGVWVAHKLKHYVYEAKLKDKRLHFHSLRHTLGV